MRSIADYAVLWLIGTLILATLIYHFAGTDWDFERSPDSGICYEVREAF